MFLSFAKTLASLLERGLVFCMFLSCVFILLAPRAKLLQEIWHPPRRQRRDGTTTIATATYYYYYYYYYGC